MQDLKQQLEEESAHRKQVERELELQIQMKAESEMAAKLLEKDIHEKQDTIISLRRQLDDIKVINLEMYRKLQVRFLLIHLLIYTYLKRMTYMFKVIPFSFMNINPFL